MLKRIRIQNFQSHDMTVLDLHPGINVLVGPSDSGKTAVLRAIRWIRNNRPLGSSFIRKGTDSVGVLLDATDNQNNSHVISRAKGPKENEYSVDGKQFSAMGSDVPDLVSAVLNLSEVNLQFQFDAPFFVMDTPGEAAGRIDGAVHLEVVNRAVDYLNSQYRKVQSAFDVAEAETREVKEKLKSYEGLDGIEQSLSEVRSLFEDMIRKAKSAQRILGLLDSIEKVNVEREKIVLPEGIETRIQGLYGDCQKVENTATNIRRLSGILDGVGLQIADLIVAEQNGVIARKALATELERVKACPFCGRPMTGDDLLKVVTI